MFENIEVFFSDFTTSSVVVRLVLATIMGSLVGMERAHKRYAAGIRTFALVCLGSALATIMGYYFALEGGATDLGRIPGQILCGIGFLGAGTIIVTDRKQVKGLTTAAGLWVTSAMGIAVGAGFIWAALVCLCLILITTYFMYYMTKFVENHTRTLEIYVEADRKAVESLLHFIKGRRFLILSMERKNEPPILDGDVSLRIELDIMKNCHHALIIDELMEVEGVHYIEEIG